MAYKSDINHNSFDLVEVNACKLDYIVSWCFCMVKGQLTCMSYVSAKTIIIRIIILS